MSILKKNVRTSEELQQYLQEQCVKTDRLYHYTSLDALFAIISGKSFRLTRMDLVNDRAERKQGPRDFYLRNYIMSFTIEREYVSMWAMYGKASSVKLRLDFPRECFMNTIGGNFYFDSNKSQHLSLYSDPQPGNFYKKDYFLSDVVYTDKKTHILRHKEKDFPSITATEDIALAMSGFIKYDAWEFEREVRLKVRIEENNTQNNADKDTPEYIYAGINDELIRRFHITFNPWMSKHMKKFVKASLDNLSGFHLEYDDSINDGEIAEL